MVSCLEAATDSWPYTSSEAKLFPVCIRRLGNNILSQFLGRVGLTKVPGSKENVEGSSSLAEQFCTGSQIKSAASMTPRRTGTVETPAHTHIPMQ